MGLDHLKVLNSRDDLRVEREEVEVHGPIIVGADGSETSRLAITEAAAIAKGSGQGIVVVFVHHIPASAFGPFAIGSVRPVLEAIDTDAALAEAQSVAILDPTGLSWRFEVRTGDPATELMEVGYDFGADTIVVAGRRHGALSSFAHAAVTARLLHRWPRSLLVVHPFSHEDDRSSAGAIPRQ